ncbi:MAG: HEAT repeat domain-containing protein [Candidatus Riflebacteria bacterium]|nr:HEAT repeat domain-containing protein [Candidatus Riflebacteria bacterium]
MTSLSAAELQRLAELLSSPDKTLRAKAVVLLARSGMQEARALLENVAASDASSEIREYARKVLSASDRVSSSGASPAVAKAGGSDATPKVPSEADLQRALNSGDRRLIAGAVRYAMEHGVRSLAPEVVRLLESAPDPELLPALAVAAGWLGAGVGHLLALLGHPDPRVRAGAIGGLEKLADPAALPALLERLRDDEPRCRTMAARALGTFGLERQLRCLEAMLRGPELARQETAAYALGFLTTPAAFGLFKLALASPHRLVRDQARASLARLAEKGNDRAADLLDRIGGQRLHLSEDDLFSRLSAVDSEADAPTESSGSPRRRSEDDLLHALSESGHSPGTDLDFLARDELREASAHQRLAALATNLGPAPSTDLEDPSAREARALEALSRVTSAGAQENLPGPREELRMQRAHERLVAETAGLVGVATADQALLDRDAREGAVLERLQALS